MRSLLSLIVIALLSLTVVASAQTAQNAPKKNPGTQSQVKKNYYGRGMQAHWGAGCKMSGSC